MTTASIGLPRVATRDEWLAARRKLLAREKRETRERDAIAAERRRLPMVKVEKDYRFRSASGEHRLVDLFEGRRQLYVHHFMWIDSLDQGCPGCTSAADTTFGNRHMLEELHRRDITFVAIARAPIESIERYRSGRAWDFPFYSSAGSDFNYDFHATLDGSRGPIEYNYRNREELLAAGVPEAHLEGDKPANSVFLRDGEDVYHTYSAYERGLDLLYAPMSFLDLTPYGRQEDWEDSPPGWPQRPTYG